MKFLVGGREIDLTSAQVTAAMVDQEPEVVREYFVELASGWFPPKQILECVAGWSRGTFTSYEAIRVLKRLGFSCRRVDELSSAHLMNQTQQKGDAVSVSEGSEVDQFRDALKVLEVAVAGLARRVELMESI
jgi:hypothetical protein